MVNNHSVWHEKKAVQIECGPPVDRVRTFYSMKLTDGFGEQSPNSNSNFSLYIYVVRARFGSSFAVVIHRNVRE